MHASLEGEEAGGGQFAEDFGGGRVGKGSLEREEREFGCVGADEVGSVAEEREGGDGRWWRGGCGRLGVGVEKGLREVGEESESRVKEDGEGVGIGCCHEMGIVGDGYA